MGLNIKNIEVERLATELARMTGESKTEAIRRALIERRDRLTPPDRAVSLQESALTWLRTEVWPNLSPASDRRRLPPAEAQELGFDVLP